MVSVPQIAVVRRDGFRLTGARQTWQMLALVGLVGWLYYPILSRLALQWWKDPNFSHGFIVPLFSGWLIWQRRAWFASTVPRPSFWGFVVMMLAMSLLGVGVLGADIFISRISFLVLIAGLVIFFRGWRYFQAALFPWAFLLLMIPIPAIIFEQLTFPLQLLASKAAASLLSLAGVPVLREGNVIHLPSISLEVAQACSGIRSLLSLVTLAIVYGCLTESRKLFRVLLAIASVPIAVAANCLRIVGTGMLGQYWDPSKAEGFFHAFSSWLMFIVSLGALVLFHQTLRPLRGLKPQT